MPFADSSQRATALQHLLSYMDLGHLWTPTGPTEEAQKLRDKHSSKRHLSHAQEIMFLVACDLWWGGKPTYTLGEAFSRFDRTSITLLTSLLAAIAEGPEACAKWLKKWPLIVDGVPEGYDPPSAEEEEAERRERLAD